MAHKVFIFFLVFVISGAVLSLSVRGCSYYLTSVPERPFRTDYETMKASGTYSHGLGILGASLIVVGVSTYSTRKRMRRFWNLGKLSVWLEFHIFLCLLGPILVTFHTTFKAGGIAAISLWTMLSVAASGIIGRFLYSQIPHNIKGTELSTAQIKDELERLGAQLGSTTLGVQIIRMIDDLFSRIAPPDSFTSTISTFFRLHTVRQQSRRMIHAMISRSSLSQQAGHELYKVAASRALLLQKSVILAQAGRLFYYWHAIHLPFTIIMFVTLAAHIVAAVLMGYTWIF